VIRAAFLRRALAAIAAIDLLSFAYSIADARSGAALNGLTVGWFTDLASRTPCTTIVIAIGVVGAIAFGSRPGRLGAGAVALAALALLSTLHAQLFGSPWRHLYFSGVCLLGWLLGLAVARRRGTPLDESYAHIGSLALLGAAYLNGGISKLVYGGIDWVWGASIQAIIVAQDGLVRDNIASAYRAWVVTTPLVATMFAIVTLGVEFLAPLMVVRQPIRRLVACGLFVMHANIYVLTAILYWQSMVFLVLFGLSADEPPEDEAATAIPVLERGFPRAAVVLALCALLAILHQSRRYARSQQQRAVSAPTYSTSR